MLMIKELSFIQIGNWIVKYVYFMFIAPANLPTSLDLSSNKEFQNVFFYWAYDTNDTRCLKVPKIHFIVGA